MGTDEVLDLRDVNWPLCLLRFNEAIRSRLPGATLEVWIRDPRIAENVNIIVRNSGYRVTRIDRVEDGFRLRIRNHESPHPGSGSGERSNR